MARSLVLARKRCLIQSANKPEATNLRDRGNEILKLAGPKLARVNLCTVHAA
jgi:hypothetical protein